MSVLDRAALVPVNVGPCRCEGAPHEEGDVVSLAPALSAAGGVACLAIINRAIGGDGIDARREAEIAAESELARVFLHDGIRDWTFVDDDGAPIPITAENIDAALPWGEAASSLYLKAGELYMNAVAAPFQKALSPRALPRSRTVATRATNGSSSNHRKPRRRSSATTTAGKR